MTQRQPDEQEKLNATLERALLEALAPVAPPVPLRARVIERVRAAGEWRAALAGVEVRTLRSDESGMVSFLLRAQPGASLPAHVHHADEECLVLEGEFTMGDRTLRAGDFDLGRKGELHPLATTHTGVLVYLRGAAVDYPFALP